MPPSLASRKDESDRCDQLPDVPLRMLCRVKKKTDHGRRQTGASNSAGIEQRRLLCLTELGQRSGDCLIERRRERRRILRRGSWNALRREHGTLSRRQLFAAGVGEETIQTAGGVPGMEAYRGGVCGGSPDLIDGQSLEMCLDLFAALKQTVGDRLKQGGDARDRPAQPPLGRRLPGAHCLVTVQVPVKGASVPLVCAVHVPFALPPSNVAVIETSADASGGASYLAVILLPSNESALNATL